MAVVAYNKVWQSSGLSPVASGEVKCESNKIHEARATYDHAGVN